jgi:ankyrin repeat protein
MATRERNTALIEAASHGHVEVAQRLLAAGADPNLRTARGETALLRATSRNSSGAPNPQMIELLKQAGAR